MQRHRWLMIVFALVLGVLAAYLLVRQAARADEFVTIPQTTLNDFNSGQFVRTGLATFGDSNEQSSGAVSLIALGVAGKWITDTGTNLTPMFGQGTIEHNGYLYTLGGRLSGGLLTNSVYRARIITASVPHALEPFTELITTPLPSSVYPNGVYLHATAVVSDFVYVIGGADTNVPLYFTNVVFSRINPTTGLLDGWQSASAALPAARFAAGVAVVSDTIYILGGETNGFAVTKSVYYARPDGNGDISQWHQAADLSRSVFGNMAASSGGYLYNLGGWLGTGDFYYNVDYAQPSGDGNITAGAWLSTTAMHNNVFRGSAVSINGLLLTTGGAVNNATTASDYVGASLQDADGTLPFWADSQNIEPPRLWHSAVVDKDGYLYIVGGTLNGISPINTGIINIGRTAGAGAQAYAPYGQYMSRIIQLGDINRFLDSFRWVAWLPTQDVTLTMSYRFQAKSGAWSDWYGPYPTSGAVGTLTTTLALSDTAQFFQYRADFRRTDGITNQAIYTTPFLLSADVTYFIPSPPQLDKHSDPPDQIVSGAPGEVAPGASISYTVVLTSNSKKALPGALVKDLLPAGTSFVAGSAYVSATFPITFHPALGSGNVISWELGTLPAYSTTVVVLGYAAMVSNNVTLGQLLTNTISFQSDVTAIGLDTLRQTRHVVNAPINLRKLATTSGVPSSPGTVETGDKITYTVVLSNPNSVALSNAIITDSVPANTSYVPGSAVIGPPGSGSVDESNLPALRWTAPTIGAGSSITAQFTVVVTTTLADTIISNQALATTRQSMLHSSNAIYHTVVTRAMLGKTAVPPSGSLAVRGSLISYTLAYTNPNGIGLDIVLSDTVPANTIFVSCTNGCTQPSTGVLNWALTVGPNSSGAVRFAVQIDPATASGVTITNRASLGSNRQHSLSFSGLTTHTVTSLQLPLLSKFATPPSGSQVQRGSTIAYRLVYTNSDPSLSSDDMVLTDILTSGVHLVTGSCAPACAVDGNTLTWHTGPVGAAQGGQVVFSATVDSGLSVGAQLVNTGLAAGCVSGQCTATVQSNSTTHTVAAGLTGAILKSAHPAAGTTLEPGARITYTLDYSNPNTSALSNVVINDPLPANTDFVSASSGGSLVGGVVSWNKGTVVAGASGQVQLVVQVKQTAPDHTIIANQASLSTDGGVSASQIVSHTVLVAYDLQLTKTVNVTATVPGSTFTYTLAYTNQGNIALTGVVISDSLGVVPPGQPSKPVIPYLQVLRSTPGWQIVLSNTTGITWSYSIPTLGPNASGILTMVVHLDGNMPVDVNLMRNGAWITDDGMHGREKNPANQAAEVITPIQGPDLAISNARFTSVVIKPGGVDVTVNATLVNQGLTKTLSWEGNSLFAVELYARPVGLFSGPPSSVFDHAGGMCSQLSMCYGNDQRAEYVWSLNDPTRLKPGESVTATWTVALPIGTSYRFYIQADVSNVYDPIVDKAYGRVLEYDELNNLVFLGTMPGTVYLPVIVRK